jgi:hypothetical protein
MYSSCGCLDADESHRQLSLPIHLCCNFLVGAEVVDKMLYANKEIEKKTNGAERNIVETTIILSSNHQAQPPIHDDEGLTLDYWGQSPLHHVRAAPLHPLHPPDVVWLLLLGSNNSK